MIFENLAKINKKRKDKAAYILAKEVKCTVSKVEGSQLHGFAV